VIGPGRCLGDKVADLADGRLAPAAAERALAHVAVCRTCRDALAAQREASARLSTSPQPEAPPDLLARLRRIDPAPAWSSPDSVAIPVQPAAGRRPAGAAGVRPGSTGSSLGPSAARRRHRRRITFVSAAGVAAVAVAALVGGTGSAVSGPAAPHPVLSIAPVVDRLTDAHAAATDQMPFSGPRIVTVAFTGDPTAQPTSPAP
jgi:hypothetical protein